MLKDLFPHWHFAPSASVQAIVDVEATLNVSFPQELRALYSETDGIRESVGNAKYLLSLRDEDSIGSLVTTTKHFWEEWAGVWPGLDFRPYIFFGFSSSDEAWGINWKRPGEIIAYHHHMEGTFEVVGAKIIDVYRADIAKYGPA
ncbi:hypothetical protein PI87_20450 [Ralstonia sp. A12]|uniref:SMI1/KNR4 family protein n=1 Tax=Ralstonia sp. A12 TaxID=1217052 RepID=UPI0005740C91|nr:SMI1/KNR4 family protein [Ralstonia sp. A12]KHK51917.1 hypothetical protein PI87_20450 [Ralstonia sp. A12]